MVLTPELAEFVGILIGDGYIYTNKNKYIIGFTGSPITDKDYYEYVKELIRKVWKKEVTIKERNKGLRIAFGSKEISDFLINGLGLAHGIDKSENIVIPECITKEWRLVKHSIRGIVDTDGSIFVAKKPGVIKYPSIEITTSSPKLALQLHGILTKNGFRVAKIWKYKSKLSKRTTYKVPLNGFENLDKWVREISFSNPYKLNRAKKALMGRGGFEPPTDPAQVKN